MLLRFGKSPYGLPVVPVLRRWTCLRNAGFVERESVGSELEGCTGPRGVLTGEGTKVRAETRTRQDPSDREPTKSRDCAYWAATHKFVRADREKARHD